MKNMRDTIKLAICRVLWLPVVLFSFTASCLDNDELDPIPASSRAIYNHTFSSGLQENLTFLQELAKAQGAYASNAGIIGLIGLTGLTGMKGLTGMTGRAGMTGHTGRSGLTGLTGAIGSTGMAGVTGITSGITLTDVVIDLSSGQGVVFNNLTTNVTTTNSIYVSSAAKLTVNSTMVVSGSLRVKAGVNLTVNGDLFVYGGLVVESTASVKVTGSFICDGLGSGPNNFASIVFATVNVGESFIIKNYVRSGATPAGVAPVIINLSTIDALYLIVTGNSITNSIAYSTAYGALLVSSTFRCLDIIVSNNVSSGTGGLVNTVGAIISTCNVRANNRLIMENNVANLSNPVEKGSIGAAFVFCSDANIGYFMARRNRGAAIGLDIAEQSFTRANCLFEGNFAQTTVGSINVYGVRIDPLSSGFIIGSEIIFKDNYADVTAAVSSVGIGVEIIQLNIRSDVLSFINNYALSSGLGSFGVRVSSDVDIFTDIFNFSQRCDLSNNIQTFTRSISTNIKDKTGLRTGPRRVNLYNTTGGSACVNTNFPVAVP